MLLLVKRYRYSLLPLLFYTGIACADNEDTFRQLHQGLELHQQRQEANAVGDGRLSLERGSVANSNNLMLALLQAINAYHGDEVRRLLALYEQQPDKDEDMLLFAQANVAIADDNLPAAIALYRQLYDHNPQFLRGKLDLARLLFVDKQNRESRDLFADIQIPGHPVINEKIHNFIAALDSRKGWHGTAAVGAVYATNLNHSPERTILRPQLSCAVDSQGIPITDSLGQVNCTTIYLPAYTAKAATGSGLAYELSLNKLTPLRGHHNLQLVISGFGRWYRSERAFNEHNGYVNLDYVYQDRRNTFGAGPVYQASVLGQHLQSSSAGLDMNFSHEFSPHAYAGLQGQYKYDNYRSRVYQRFNGVQAAVFTNFVYVLPYDWVVFGGYDFLHKASREAVDSYYRHGARLGLNKKFSWGIDVALQASWRQSRYQDYNAWLQTRRQDQTQTYQIDMKLDKLAMGQLVPVLSYKRVDNHSYSWVNSYKNDEWFLKLDYRF